MSSAATPKPKKAAAPQPIVPAGVPEYLVPYFADIAKSEGLVAEYRIEYEQGARPGDGFMSDLLAITLAGKRRQPEADADADAEHRVAIVCKLQPTSAARKDATNNSIMFEREVFVYNRLFPLLNRLQRGRGLTEANGGFFAVPRLYVASMNVFYDESFIIMEDLRPRGFRMWPKQKTVQFEHARLLLQQLGRFHGLSFVLKDQRPDLYEEYMAVPDHYRHLIEADSARSMFDSTFRRAERLLERPADKRLMAKLRTGWAEIFYGCLDVKKMGKWAVFGHSDCWNNNMLFRTDENDKPTEVCLLDWQFARPISPADDFIMYLCSTTEKPLRDAHYDEFLHIYHDSLSDIVRLCGSEPEKLFSFDDFLSTLSVYGNYGVLEAALTVSIMVADNDSVADMDQMAAVAGSAAEEEETGHFVHFNARTEALYKTRLADVLEDARKYKWFSFDVDAE